MVTSLNTFACLVHLAKKNCKHFVLIWDADELSSTLRIQLHWRMRGLGTLMLDRGKEIASKKINISNCKRTDSGGAWVIKTRRKTQTGFNIQKQFKKPHRNMDRHLCHPCVGTRQLHADGAGCNHPKG